MVHNIYARIRGGPRLVRDFGFGGGLRLSASPSTRFAIITYRTSSGATLRLYDGSGALCSSEETASVTAARAAAAYYFPTDALQWMELPPDAGNPVALVLDALDGIGRTPPKDR